MSKMATWSVALISRIFAQASAEPNLGGRSGQNAPTAERSRKYWISENSCDLQGRHYLNALLFVYIREIRGQIKRSSCRDKTILWLKTAFFLYKKHEKVCKAKICS